LSTAPLIGIDLGGTKVEGAVLAADGTFLMRERRATPQGDYDGTLQVIAALVRQADTLIGSGAPRPVGIAMPGSISPSTGRVRNANSTVLNGRPLQSDLERLLQRPVRLENDANCLAASEATDGAARGDPLVFAVILGTGVGAGLAWQAGVWPGRNGIAGEWGHNPLPWPREDWGETGAAAPRCWCGLAGCIETWLSGPALALDHRRLGGEDVAAPAVIERCRHGDATARAAFDRYADRLARALAHTVNLLDPSCIVLGGGMSRVDALYDEVPRRWAAYVFADAVDTPLRAAAHGDSSGVRGAAWLWRQAGKPMCQSASTGSSEG
jgi:fructokinase